MSKRRKRSVYGASSDDKVKPGVIAAALVLVALLGAVATMILTAVPPNRGDNLCTKNGPAGIIVLIIDASGEMSSVQKVAIRDRFFRAMQHASPPEVDGRIIGNEYRLDVYDAQTNEGAVSAPAFSKCSPAPLGGLSKMAANSRKEERTYQTEFEEPLERILTELIGKPEANVSPLLESFTAAAEQSFAGSQIDDRLHVIYASDLIQNSSVLSFYGSGVGEFRDFQMSAGYNAVRPDLRGAVVCPMIIKRSGRTEASLQTVRLVRWWEQYIEANRGRIDGVCVSDFQL